MYFFIMSLCTTYKSLNTKGTIFNSIGYSSLMSPTGNPPFPAEEPTVET